MWEAIHFKQEVATPLSIILHPQGTALDSVDGFKYLSKQVMISLPPALVPWGNVYIPMRSKKKKDRALHPDEMLTLARSFRKDPISKDGSGLKDSS